MARRRVGAGRARMTVATADGVARIREQIHEARARGEALRVSGSGTWLEAGRPCAASTRLDVSALSGISRYEPGDFVLTARAGTTLAEIADAARAHGQWLTLDPAGDARGTIGATIATASYGPLASAYGTPRDHILGCEFVSGTGDVIRAGGQVVKNVAGFDLVRLVTGAWGTLGVITEVTLRMRAVPEVDRTLAITLDREPATSFWKWLRETEFTPLAAELVSRSLAQALGIGDAPTALIRFGGNATLVRAASDATASLGVSREVEAGIWQRLGTALSAMPVSFRASALPSRIDALWRLTHSLVDNAGGLSSATVGRGVVRCALPQACDAAQVDALARELTLAGEQLPAASWPAFQRSRGTLGLEQRVQRAFDPQGILNPGILGT